MGVATGCGCKDVYTRGVGTSSMRKSIYMYIQDVDPS